MTRRFIVSMEPWATIVVESHQRGEKLAPDPADILTALKGDLLTSCFRGWDVVQVDDGFELIDTRDVDNPRPYGNDQWIVDMIRDVDSLRERLSQVTFATTGEIPVGRLDQTDQVDWAAESNKALDALQHDLRRVLGRKLVAKALGGA